MIDAHASALAVVRELHGLGATEVEVGPEHVAAKFDRVFVPVSAKTTMPITSGNGDEIAMSADDVQALKDENEHMKSLLRTLEERGVL